MTWASAEGLKYQILCRIGSLSVEVENQDGDYQVNVKATFLTQGDIDVFNQVKRPEDNVYLTVIDDKGPKVLYAIY